MMNSDDFEIQVRQLNHISFEVIIKNKDNISFISNVQCNPNQLTKENILNNFKNNKNQWDIIADLEFIKEEKATDITLETPKTEQIPAEIKT